MKKDKAALTGTTIFSSLLALVLIKAPAGEAAHVSTEAPWVRSLVERDLGAMRVDTLRVLVMRDPLTWEQYPGAESGLEWELIERFAQAESLMVKAIPVDHPDSMLMKLQRGDGDLMAAQLTAAGWAKGFVQFTEPYRSVAPIRITLNTDALVRVASYTNSGPARFDTLVMSRWSPFAGSEHMLDSSEHRNVVLIDTLTPEDLMIKVALGQCRSAVMNDAAGLYDARRLPHVAFGPRLGRSIPLAFAVRTNAPQLCAALNAWLLSEEEVEAREMLIRSYADSRLTQGPMRTLRSLQLDADSISPFDSLFQAHADNSAFDWKLFAAVAFKESRFDASASSHAGAGGLMQIMPATAVALGIDTADGVGGHIRGAAKYLAELDTMWRRSVANKDQRLKFILASYNAGPGHVKDAQRLAARFGLDPRRWDGSVERTILLLSRPRFNKLPEVKTGYCRGYETFWYVRDVVNAFGQFRRKVS